MWKGNRCKELNIGCKMNAHNKIVKGHQKNIAELKNQFSVKNPGAHITLRNSFPSSLTIHLTEIQLIRSWNL